MRREGWDGMGWVIGVLMVSGNCLGPGYGVIIKRIAVFQIIVMYRPLYHVSISIANNIGMSVQYLSNLIWSHIIIFRFLTFGSTA